jgi:hypothetical protein
MHSAHLFTAVQTEIPHFYYGTKHEILNVSKCHKQYLHVTACWQIDIYSSLGAGQKGLYLRLGRPTLTRLRNIFLSVNCPSYRKRCNNLWPGILGMGHCGMSATSITICLQTSGAHRTAMHHAVTHIHGEQEIKKLILSLPRY